MSSTILLDQDTWDLITDAQGNIAMATPPYARSQDVASAIRTFVNDLWYDQDAGIPYFERVLGQAPNLTFLRAQVEAAALSVPGVTQAKCLFAQLTSERTLRGQVQFIDVDGESRSVTF